MFTTSRLNLRHTRQRLDDILDYWLGYTIQPADLVIQHSGFTPDTRDTYCPRCGDSVGKGEATTTGCGSCRDKTPLADDIIRLGSYVDDLQQWILQIKYNRWAPMAAQLGQLLGQALLDAKHIDLDNTIIIPMPMPWQRRLYRGIDHAHILAAATARHLKLPLVRVLTKTHGPPQVTLSPTDRQRLGGQTLKQRWRFGGWDLSDTHVILIDDVRTTGTTIRRAVKLLRQLESPPESITAAVLAVADPASRRYRHESRVTDIEASHNDSARTPTQQ